MQAEQSPLDSGKRPRRLAGKATRPCPVLLPGLAVPQLQSRSGTTETSQLVVGTPCHHNDIAVRCVVSAVTQRVARSPGAGLCVCLGGTSVWSHLSQASLSKQRWRASARGHAAAFAHSLQAAAVANCVPHSRQRHPPIFKPPSAAGRLLPLELGAAEANRRRWGGGSPRPVFNSHLYRCAVVHCW